MMRTTLMCMFACALSACGPNLEKSCDAYVQAREACYQEAFGQAMPTTGTMATGDVCAAYDGVKGAEAKEAAEYLDCLADAFNTGDCSTPEGYGEAEFLNGCGGATGAAPSTGMSGETSDSDV